MIKKGRKTMTFYSY